MDVTQARVVVTGGASGIGNAVARRLLAEGARVAALDLPAAAAAGALPEGGTLIGCDVTDEASVAAAVAGARRALGGLDALVSCAGVATPTPVRGRSGELRALDPFRSVVAVNLVGLYDVLRHCVAAMAGNEPGPDGERGVVINLSSIAAYEGQIGQSAYAATKGAIAAMTLPLARELGPLGIRVLALCPGIVDTPMLAGMPEALRERLTALPVFPKRLADPGELAEFVLTCLRVRVLNGEVVRLDGATRLPAR
ncbi:SDR family NAD(P)-dependent oxidoreductase [Dactylosporangium sp. CS-033363]|uniref:SDR family NAD(P)-dependent oxidoreductase n=1 Tax=Dactylosporangium sp. CS-033363 TaxID=3239935 RepID=UPI003D8E34EE